MNLQASGSSYLTGGNVGIGTATPGVTLDVAGDLRATGVLMASPRMYLIEKNTQETLSSTAWADYMTQTITVDKNGANVLFLFSFSQPYEYNSPTVVWRANVGSLYSNSKFTRHATGNWNVLPGGFSFVIQNVPAGTYTARLQYKFYSGAWAMSSLVNQPLSETYNTCIIIVL